MPLILHIPHSSTYIPEEHLKYYLMPLDELRNETLLSADIFTDELFNPDIPGLEKMVNTVSRLVMDPERFPDEKEDNFARGNGFYYTNTLTMGDRIGRPLRENDASHKESIHQMYKNYHEQFEEKIQNLLDKYNKCIIIDCHSFGQSLVGLDDLPDFCIGTTPPQTPDYLYETVVKALTNYNVVKDYPFCGSMIPGKYIGDERVSSIMIEVNKWLYTDEEIHKSNSFKDVKTVLNEIIKSIFEMCN